MIYKVKAKFDDSKREEFYEKLTDGTIQNQQPDGPSMVAGIKRASIDALGLVVWSETCYCNSPLDHERTTVLDHYFTDLSAEPIEDHETYPGESFWEYLKGK